MTSSPTLMVDSYGTPDYRALRAAGVLVAGRYLAGGNPLSAAEVRRAHEAGVGVLLIWELAANAALHGLAQGRADGMLSSRIAQDLGAPHSCALFATVDFDPTPAQLDTVRMYATGFHSSIGGGYRSGLYGGTSTLEAAGSFVDVCWQSAGWSNGRKLSVPIRQLIDQETIAGVVLDEDVIDAARVEELGAWMPAPAPKLSPGAPTPQVTTPAAAPAQEKEADVKPIIAIGSKGGVQLIDAACKGRRPIPSAAVLDALVASGQYVDLRGKLDPAFVDALPVA